MSKISKAFSAIGLILRNPWLLNKVLDDKQYWRNKVGKKSGFRAGLPVLRPEALFGNFTETVDPFAFLDGGSLPTDLALLKKLAAGIDHCTYFEIGTWRGESAANVASVADSCHTLNLSDSEMREKGFDQRYIGLHRYFSKNIPNITHLEGNTLTFDFQSLNKKFDLIFIDGDHHYEMVRNDTEKVFRHLVHDKTIVVWHDYAFNPETVRYEVLAGILDGCPVNKHQNLFHIANTLCAVYFPGVSGNEKLDPPVVPIGSFNIRLEFNPL
jgi:predicted O-methyltransferase YrrM